MKEREQLALRSEYNALKHKYDIIFKEKDFFEKQTKSLTENLKRSEEKLMQQKIDIHNEKRKNEFMSRRIVEMEKSLGIITDEFNKQLSK